MLDASNFFPWTVIDLNSEKSDFLHPILDTLFKKIFAAAAIKKCIKVEWSHFQHYQQLNKWLRKFATFFC